MKDYIEKISDNVLVVAIWNEKLDYYVNNYVITREERNIFIDGGDITDLGKLEDYLQQAGIVRTEKDILVLTHGHYDHVGAMDLFESENIYMHGDDLGLIGSRRVNTDLEAFEKKSGMKTVHVGHHTKGSILVQDMENNIVFCGDLVCFFGYAVPPEGILKATEEILKLEYEFYGKAADDKEFRKEINFEPYSDFIEGIKKLKSLNAVALCSGHGIILRDNASGYINKLYEILTGK